MRVKNVTPFVFGAKVTSLRPPELCAVLVVRGAFALRPGQPVEPLGEPGDLLAQGSMSAETYREDDEERAGECLYPGDFADFKPKADVLLRGTCRAPGNKPVTECPIGFSVGAFSKALRVVGRRVWSDTRAGAVASAPLPFTQMPVDYAHAFGGPGHAPNPSGKGLGSELPNIEDPRAPVRSRGDRPAPAGFGPLSPEWPERREKRGKEYGDKWRKTRAPFYAEDLDLSYFNAAPADQQIAYPRGDEPIAFQNLCEGTPLFATRLPGRRVRAFVKDTGGRFREVRMQLDTLFADLDEGKLYLTWRGLDVVANDDLADVATVLVADEALSAAPLSEAHYRAALAAYEADPLGLEEHKPKGLPDLDEELAKAKIKLEGLAAAGAALREGPPAGSPPASVAGFLAPILGGMAPDRAAAVGTSLAEASRGLAHAAPDLDATKAMSDAARSAATRPSLPATAPATLTPPRAAQDALKAAVARMDQARKTLAEHGRALPAELEAFLGSPQFGGLLAVPEGAEPQADPAPGANLAGRDLSGRDLRGLDLRGADLRGANLSGAQLDGARLDGACLDAALFHEASLRGADLSGTSMASASFLDAQAEGAVLRGARFDKTSFARTDLTGASFEAATGAMAIFQQAKLQRAAFRGARLEQSLFAEAPVDGADFSRATLFRCLFLKASLKRASFELARLDKTSAIESDLTEAVFVEAVAEMAGFLRCVLCRADLRYATLLRSHFTESDATGAQLFAANLRESRLYRTVLKDADLTQANLFSADLGKAILTNTRLCGANLYDAKLIQASGKGCDLTDANLKRSTLENA